MGARECALTALSPSPALLGTAPHCAARNGAAAQHSTAQHSMRAPLSYSISLREHSLLSGQERSLLSSALLALSELSPCPQALVTGHPFRTSYFRQGGRVLQFSDSSGTFTAMHHPKYPKYPRQ
eukprot:3865608-Rhodomonas_salina.1